MSTNDYVKFVTQQIVSYIDHPKEERKLIKEKRKGERSPFLTRMFGILPFSLSLFIDNRKKKK